MTVLARVHIAPGEEAPRHARRGVESTYVLEGEGLVMADGLADRMCRVGDWLQVPADVPHSVRIGPAGVVVVANYPVEKDGPLVSWL